MRKYLTFVLMLDYLLSLLSLSLPAVSPRTIYVPDDYSIIQEAVDAASPGDMIVVRDGIYYESITINKLITINFESCQNLMTHF